MEEQFPNRCVIEKVNSMNDRMMACVVKNVCAVKWV